MLDNVDAAGGTAGRWERDGGEGEGVDVDMDVVSHLHKDQDEGGQQEEGEGKEGARAAQGAGNVVRAARVHLI